MSTVKKVKTAPIKNRTSKASKALPPKKISKFGQMYGVYKGLIIEREDAWD